jgi:hypothetical protein
MHLVGQLLKYIQDAWTFDIKKKYIPVIIIYKKTACTFNPAHPYTYAEVLGCQLITLEA